MTRSFFRAAVVWRLALLAAFWPVLAHGHVADDAVDAVVKLQADGRGDDAVKPVEMQRLIELAAAMRDGDWDQVARIGGPEVHKVALRGATKPRGRQA